MLVGDPSGACREMGECFLRVLVGVFLYLSPGNHPRKGARSSRSWVEAENCGEGAALGPWEG